jgi:hypothetical protein
MLRPHGRLSLCPGWGGKLCGYALRIAGLLHIAEHNFDCTLINEQTMLSALEIANSLIDHAIAAYGLIQTDHTKEDTKEVFQWIHINGQLSFTQSEIRLAMRNRSVGKAERLTKALSQLAECNLISAPQILPTRKPTTVYYVNPSIFQESNRPNTINIFGIDLPEKEKK